MTDVALASNTASGFLEADFNQLKQLFQTGGIEALLMGLKNGGFLRDVNGNEILIAAIVASAVNEITISNAATGNAPSLAATGSDSNVAIILKGKGTGAVRLGQATTTDVRLEADQPIADSSGNEYIKFVKTASAVNEVTITNNATAADPIIAASGGDSNVNLVLAGKGTGTVKVTSPVNANNNNIQSIKQAYFNVEYDNGNSGTAVNIDWTNGSMQKLTLTGNVTITYTGAPSGTSRVQLRLIQGSGPYTVTWPTTTWVGNVAPTITTTNGGVTIVTKFYNGTTYFGSSSNFT